MNRICLALLLFVASAPVALAQDRPVQVTGQGVLLDFQDAELRLVITALAEAGGLNVLYGDIPARRVTLRMQQAIQPEAIVGLLKNLAQANGLRVTDEGAFLRFDAASTSTMSTAARDSTQSGAGSDIRLFVYRLKHARASQLSGTIQTLFGGRSRTPGAGIRQVPLSESLRDTASAPRADSVPSVRVDVDVGGQRVSLPGTLRAEVQVVPEERTNSLLVRAQSDDWEILRQTIEALDVRPLQVLIEVVIAEVRKTNDRTISISGVGTDGKPAPNVKGTLEGQTAGDFALDVMKRGAGFDLRLALNTLASRGEVRIVSRPVVVAQNNQEARILIGSERPFIQASRSLPTDAGVRDQVIQYRDVGTKLTIIPTINDEGYVNLQVLQEVSTATAEVQFGAPIISTREAATHLFVRDGQTAVIGGLIDRQQERNRSGIPILMDIPLLGGLFGTTKQSQSNSELFLFLTPHILADDLDLDRARAGLRAAAPMLRQAVPDSAALPVLRDSVPPK